jgi:hypothetical protein
MVMSEASETSPLQQQLVQIDMTLSSEQIHQLTHLSEPSEKLL